MVVAGLPCGNHHHTYARKPRANMASEYDPQTDQGVLHPLLVFRIMSGIGPTVYPPATVSLGVSLDSEVDRLTLGSVSAERFTRNVQGYFENQEKDLDELQSKLPQGRQVDDADLAVLRHRQLVVLVAVSTEVRRGPFPDSRSILARSA